MSNTNLSFLSQTSNFKSICKFDGIPSPSPVIGERKVCKQLFYLFCHSLEDMRNNQIYFFELQTFANDCYLSSDAELEYLVLKHLTVLKLGNMWNAVGIQILDIRLTETFG